MDSCYSLFFFFFPPFTARLSSSVASAFCGFLAFAPSVNRFRSKYYVKTGNKPVQDAALISHPHRVGTVKGALRSSGEEILIVH